MSKFNILLALVCILSIYAEASCTPQEKLNTYTSQQVMETNGWTLHITRWASEGPGSGYWSGNTPGWAQITLEGFGTLVVDYENPYGAGQVDVYLNDVSQGHVGPNGHGTTQVTFSDGDVLKIYEGADGEPGIWKLNSITMASCSDGSTPIDCVIDNSASAATCTSACGSVSAIGFPDASNGGTPCADYQCQPGDGACPASCTPPETLNTYTSQEVMEANGWTFHNTNFGAEGPGSGYWTGNAPGWAQITLGGSGTLVVDYENPYGAGQVDVYLNDVSQGHVGPNGHGTAQFTFSGGDVLKIYEGADGEPGIWKLNSITTSCSDSSICTPKYEGAYEYGDAGWIGGVFSYDDCCKAAKQEQENQPQKNIMKFSWNGGNNRCYFKNSGGYQVGGLPWLSSQEDISTCSCGDNETTVTTSAPTTEPTVNPSNVPSKEPTLAPTKNPTTEPTKEPSPAPTANEFILRIKGFHGQPNEILDSVKLTQDELHVDRYGFEATDQTPTENSRRLLKLINANDKTDLEN